MSGDFWVDDVASLIEIEAFYTFWITLLCYQQFIWQKPIYENLLLYEAFRKNNDIQLWYGNGEIYYFSVFPLTKRCRHRSFVQCWLYVCLNLTVNWNRDFESFWNLRIVCRIVWISLYIHLQAVKWVSLHLWFCVRLHIYTRA